MKKTILITLFIYSSFSYSTEKVFQSADSLYQIHEFELAISEYYKIIDDNLESPELYYNLGVCYYQIRDYKKSKLNFQKSLVLNPNQTLSKDRIQQINSKINHKDLPQIFYDKWFDKIINLFTLKIWILVLRVGSISYKFIIMHLLSFLSKQIFALLLIT